MQKSIFAGAVMVAAMSAPAFAADLAARPYTKAPAVSVSPVYNWGGFYIGINGGGGSAHDCYTVLGSTGAGVLSPSQPDGCHSATGGTVGGQVGYRWQATNWVFGLEAQGNWADFKGSNVNLAPIGPPGAINNVSKIDTFGLFTGQVGYAVNNVLFYVKGGGAVVRDKYTDTVTAFGATLLPGFAIGQTIFSGSQTRWGGTVGAGLEYGFAPNWSVAIEYDHIFLGSHNVNLASLPPLPVGTVSYSISEHVDIGTVRVNYTFGGPVVAKY
jgi:outer membrane immunogenic protein